ncbi:MAG: hypothetical protein AB2L24_21885 [Mangrovibacterium sp.]
MTEEERADLEREIKQIKKELTDFERIFPVLDEKTEKVVNMYLEDLAIRLKKLEEFKKSKE